jgi:hypothetical protein
MPHAMPAAGPAIAIKKHILRMHMYILYVIRYYLRYARTPRMQERVIEKILK